MHALTEKFQHIHKCKHIHLAWPRRASFQYRRILVTRWIARLAKKVSQRIYGPDFSECTVGFFGYFRSKFWHSGRRTSLCFACRMRYYFRLEYRVADPRTLRGCGDPRTLFLKRVRGVAPPTNFSQIVFGAGRPVKICEGRLR